MAGRATSSRGRSLSTTSRATTTRTPKLTQVNIAQGEIYIATSRRDGSISTTRVAARKLSSSNRALNSSNFLRLTKYIYIYTLHVYMYIHIYIHI